MDNLPSSNKMTERSGALLQIVKSLVLTTLLFISSVAPIFAATEGTYEYNDFSLYSSSSGAYFSSGAFRSNNSSLTEFTLTVDMVNGTWNITDGTSTGIPLPAGVSLYYENRSDFLQEAYVKCNGTTYNFSFIDDSGVFYCQHIPAGPYYYPVAVHLPTEGTAVSVPANPVLSYSDGWLNWTPSGYYTEVYLADDAHLAGELLRYGLTGSSMKVRDGEDGYYYIRLRYTVNGEYRYTDYSNRVYGSYVATAQEEQDQNTLDNTLIKYLEDSRNGFENSVSTVSQYIRSMGALVQGLLAWMPPEVASVFWSVVIIGFILGLLIRH